MRFFAVRPVSRFRGELLLPGDKSIAHRAVILSALSKGKTRIENFPANKDCLSTVEAFKKLGIKIIKNAAGARIKARRCVITVYGKGLSGLQKPAGPVFMAESGTTFRLLLGVLAGQKFRTRVIAAKSLSKRPMLRVTVPLRMMGAYIKSKIKYQKSKIIEEYPPITIGGGNLEGISYRLPVASAQVKSALLLAGLYASGKTVVIEPLPTRDHSERMLKLFKAGIKVNKNTIVINGGSNLISPGKIYIPADISSASFFIVLAAISRDSRVAIKNVGLNPTRAGVLRVLKRMGADISVHNVRQSTAHSYEPMGDIIVKSSSLKGVTVRKKEIPSLIDEIPILMVAAGLAKGKSVFEGVGELRVKETDRVKSMVYNLRRMGADITVSGGGPSEKVIIHGVDSLKGSRLKSFGDHRSAMSVIAAALNAKGRSSIDDISCINKSFPDFITLLGALKA